MSEVSRTKDHPKINEATESVENENLFSKMNYNIRNEREHNNKYQSKNMNLNKIMGNL